MVNKISGRNLQKKTEKDCSSYNRVKKSAKTKAQRVARRKLQVALRKENPSE